MMTISKKTSPRSLQVLPSKFILGQEIDSFTAESKEDTETGFWCLRNPFGPDLRGPATPDRKGFNSPVIKAAEKNSFSLRGNSRSKADLWLHTRL